MRPRNEENPTVESELSTRTSDSYCNDCGHRTATLEQGQQLVFYKKAGPYDVKNNFGCLENINIYILVNNILHVRHDLGCYLFCVYINTNNGNKSRLSNRYLKLICQIFYSILTLNIFDRPVFLSP